MDITELDPATAPAADLAGWHDVAAACARHEQPKDPERALADTIGWLRVVRPTEPRMRWVARQDGVIVGTAELMMPTRENLDTGFIELSVHPDHRRRGHGRALLGTVLDALRSAGRGLAWTGTIECGEGAAAADRLGVAPTDLREVRSVLDLPTVDAAAIAAIAAEPRPGYRLERWVGAAPDDRVDAYAEAKHAMADAPHDPRWEPPRWDARRVRNLEDQPRQAGYELRVVVAVREGTDAVAGLTEVIISPWTPYRADQWDTVVIPAHRGHGLGIWVKAEMLRWLAAERPDVRQIETWNAETNRHMRGINTRLGFRPDLFYQDRPIEAAELAVRLGR